MKSRISSILICLIGLLCLLPDLPLMHWRAFPAWVGLLSGILLALLFGNPFIRNTRKFTPKLLSWSVIGLGAAMNLKTVALVGLQGFGYTLIGISVTLALGALIGTRLKVGRNTAVLVSVGTAICGGSAIAAAAPVIRAKEEETSMALATVFFLNATALLIFPVIGHLLHLEQRAFGLWSALAIHDTSSVVGASSDYGRDALIVAATTKLARALWIVPVTFLLGIWIARVERHAANIGKAKRPWFILGFVIAAGLVTFIPMLKPAGLVVSEAARRSLVLTLFFLGLGLNRESIASVGVRPFLLGVLLWFLVGTGTLVAIVIGLVR